MWISSKEYKQLLGSASIFYEVNNFPILHKHVLAEKSFNSDIYKKIPITRTRYQALLDIKARVDKYGVL
jgi:hypothetical protein